MKKLPRSFSTVADIQIIKGNGPWNTKSGGKLNVIVAIPLLTAQKRFFRYEDGELNRVSHNLRGLRIYTVSDLPNGGIGGHEWHRIREEIVFALEGSVHWICEDVFGGKKDFILTKGSGIWMPPFILHTYAVMREGSVLLVIANTLFSTHDPETHDIYPMIDFRALQAEHAAEQTADG